MASENRELFRFGCEGYLGELTREHAEKIAELEAKLETARRRAGRLPDAAADDREHRRPRRRARGSSRPRERADRGAPEPALPRRRPRDPACRARPRRADVLRALPRPLRVSTSKGSPSSAARSSTRRSACTRSRWTGSLRERVGRRPRRGRAPRHPPLLPRLELGQGVSRRPDAARAARRRSANLGIDLDAQENVHLDVEERPTKTPRAFCAPIEIPGKVMLVIQPQGGPDDWYALFHEAGHTEHFAFTSPDLKMEEKRLGDNAVTEGWAMLFDHLIDDRAWLEQHARLPAAGAVRRRGRRAAPLLRPPLLGEAPLRDRVPRGATTRRRCGAGTSSCSATRSRSSRARRTTSPTSTRASTSPPTCARGRSRRR